MANQKEESGVVYYQEIMPGCEHIEIEYDFFSGEIIINNKRVKLGTLFKKILITIEDCEMAFEEEQC